MLLDTCGHQETFIWDKREDISRLTIRNDKNWKIMKEKISFKYRYLINI